MQRSDGQSVSRIAIVVLTALMLVLSACSASIPESAAVSEALASQQASGDRPVQSGGAQSVGEQASQPGNDQVVVPESADSANTSASVDTAAFSEVTGSTNAGDFGAQLPTGVSSRVEENSFWDITDYYHVYDEGGRFALFLVSDRTDHFGDEDADAQAEGAQYLLFELEFMGRSSTANGDGEPIMITPIDSDREIIGHTLDITNRGQSGKVQFVARDLVWYGLVGFGFSDAEWEFMASSLRTHYIPPATDEELAEIAEADAEAAGVIAEAQQILASTNGVAFSEGPFGPRELNPATGGWGYLGGAPFGGVEPGTDAAMDVLWVDCRNGDGFACDSLHAESEFGSVYERFGQTCGARTANVGCDELLGSELHPDFFGPYLPDIDFYRNRVDGFRLDRIPGPQSLPPGEDELKDALWVLCGLGGDPEACRELFRDRDIIGDVYQSYGWSCGGRRPALTGYCRTLMSDPVDRIATDTPAPGTLGGEADQLWIACAEDAEACVDLAFYPFDIAQEDRPENWDNDWPSYREFARACGGRYDQPLSQDTCRGGNEYIDWPVVDNVDELPVQPLADG